MSNCSIYAMVLAGKYPEDLDQLGRRNVQKKLKTTTVVYCLVILTIGLIALAVMPALTVELDKIFPPIEMPATTTN